MKQRQLDHLHVHFGGAVAAVGMLTAQMWQVPFSLTIHGPEELLDFNAYHLREKIAAARFVICVSDFCRSQLYLHTPPSDWSKFKVVRLGVDPVMLSPRKNPPMVSALAGAHQTAGAERILEMVSVGRMVPQKGHRILLEALQLLHERGLSLHTTFIGGGPDLAELEERIRLQGLGEFVTCTGALSHDQTLAYLRRADLFTLGSFAEGIPVALMEAMSLGLACVSTTIAGIPELLRSGVDGLLVPPGNAAALADAVESLLHDPALRRQLGASARQRILSSYNLPRNQELLAQTFAENIHPAHPLRQRPAS
jgi:glycosyltransferase involved in cell wall biosynthesis